MFLDSGDDRETARRVLAHEAKALLTRLDRVRSFALTETMVPAAALSPSAQLSIDRAIAASKRDLAEGVNRYLDELRASAAAPREMQRRFTLLRLRFNAVLSQLDIFAQAVNQRSEHETGVFLAGLDAAARDALSLRGGYYDPPPVVCYLDRGLGAAIRRARTRLPGGVENPVAIIRVPRERMVGTGIGASLIHEVGHQGAALLDLVPHLRAAITRVKKAPSERGAWSLWGRWISEIVADLWSMAHLGVGATFGLLSVVSLPPFFVFRPNEDDPHPTPWIRVKLSAAMGRALFPSPQWGAIESLWGSLYPPDELDAEHRRTLSALEATAPELVELMLEHTPPRLRGATLREALPAEGRDPKTLNDLHRRWRASPADLRRARPTLALAALGQARSQGELDAGDEGRIIADLLGHWALDAAHRTAVACGP